MGEDKCFINYHGKPQCYYVYEMLQNICQETFISCNAQQSLLIHKKYKTLEDLKMFGEKGPATGVLTAFSSFPKRDFLVIGCDYPLMSEKEIRYFLDSIPPNVNAAAFYDAQDHCYQPVLAWYSSASGNLLLNSAENTRWSLKQLLQDLNAHKYTPVNEAAILSADTKKVKEMVQHLTNNN